MFSELSLNYPQYPLLSGALPLVLNCQYNIAWTKTFLEILQTQFNHLLFGALRVKI